MNKRTFLLCLAWLPVSAAFAKTDALAGISQRLQPSPVVRGSFEQVKRVAGFRQPLESRGTFVLARERGVVWTTTTPFPSTLAVTANRIVSRDAQGKTQALATTASQPGLPMVSATILAILRGDLSALSDRFATEGTLLSGMRWTMRLQPKDAAMQQMFSRIDLEGDRFVRQVQMTEANGDSVVIRFTRLTGAAQLSPDEERGFE